MSLTLLCGDSRRLIADLPGESIDTCVTSPPYYGLRDYGQDGQIGLERSFEDYVAELVDLFGEVRRADEELKRNRRTVWTLGTSPYRGAHFATFPEKLVEPCILAGCPEGGTVLDPFSGSGTTMIVAARNSRSAIGLELNPAYCDLASKRIASEGLGHMLVNKEHAA